MAYHLRSPVVTCFGIPLEVPFRAIANGDLPLTGQVLSYYKMNLLRTNENMASSAPKNAATNKLITITTNVYWMVCFRLGQLTRASSIFTSFKNATNLLMFIIFYPVPIWN